jgi:Zn-dependent protease
MLIQLTKNGIDGNTIIYVIAFLLAVLCCISVHEYAHAYVAKKMGDDTATRLGRFTLNPIAHLDLMGSLSFLLFGFGWAKPVPINPIKFKDYRKGLFLVSIAGVVANIFFALFSAGLYMLVIRIFLSVNSSSQFVEFLNTFLQTFFGQLFYLNLELAIFNLLPLAPLDGFNVLFALTKEGNKVTNFLQKNGSTILIGLLIVTAIIEPYLPFLAGDSILGYVANYLAMPMMRMWWVGISSVW